MTQEKLSQDQDIWSRKPVLRQIYQDYYTRLIKQLKPGKTLEIGGGRGGLKDSSRNLNIIVTDIVPTQLVNVACDAQQLPFADQTFDNIVGMDVLHHLEFPSHFFREAARVLKPGGRIIFLEPAITPSSWFFYHFFHQEPVILKDDPLKEGTVDTTRDPFDSNQAIPELLFGRDYEKFRQIFPELHLVRKQHLSLFAYPLSGGFKKWCLIPQFTLGPLLRIERFLEKLLGRFIGFRLLTVVEKL